MRLIARFHRWRLAKTTFWLPFEQQLHALLLADSRFSPIRDVLADQIATLYIAYREQNLSELAATYSYRCSCFYDESEDFTLCRIEAANAQGTIRFWGGMMSEIRVKPSTDVVNPVLFRLAEIRLSDVFIPAVREPLAATGWTAELERKGILSRYGLPTSDIRSSPTLTVPREYGELFAGCQSASINLNGEQFHFLEPGDQEFRPDQKPHEPLPILDLRESGGLAISSAPDNQAKVSFLSDGRTVWSEPSLARAIERLYNELGS